MCGDLEDYDPGKHVELLLDGIKKHIGNPHVASSSTWAQVHPQMAAAAEALYLHMMQVLENRRGHPQLQTERREDAQAPDR